VLVSEGEKCERKAGCSTPPANEARYFSMAKVVFAVIALGF
jgi:hypothetical protein